MKDQNGRHNEFKFIVAVMPEIGSPEVVICDLDGTLITPEPYYGLFEYVAGKMQEHVERGRLICHVTTRMESSVNQTRQWLIHYRQSPGLIMAAPDKLDANDPDTNPEVIATDLPAEYNKAPRPQMCSQPGQAPMTCRVHKYTRNESAAVVQTGPIQSLCCAGINPPANGTGIAVVPLAHWYIASQAMQQQVQNGGAGAGVSGSVSR